MTDELPIANVRLFVQVASERTHDHRKETPDYKKRRAKKRKTIEKEFNSQAQKNVHVIIVGN
jgi:hypothetical protein